MIIIIHPKKRKFSHYLVKPNSKPVWFFSSSAEHIKYILKNANRIKKITRNIKEEILRSGAMEKKSYRFKIIWEWVKYDINF